MSKDFGVFYKFNQNEFLDTYVKHFTYLLYYIIQRRDFALFYVIRCRINFFSKKVVRVYLMSFHKLIPRLKALLFFDVSTNYIKLKRNQNLYEIYIIDTSLDEFENSNIFQHEKFV